MRYCYLSALLAALLVPVLAASHLQATESSPAAQATRPAPRFEIPHCAWARPPFEARFAKDAKFWISLHLRGMPELPSPDKILAQFPQYVQSEEIRKLLQPGVGLGYFEANFREGPPDLTEYGIALAGTTGEQAEQLGQAVLAMYFAWWQDHSQEFITQKIKDLQHQAAELDASVEEAQKQRKADLATLGGSELTSQTANDLRTRQLLLEVDLAGVQTKIDTAQKLLQDERGTGRHSNTWKEQLEAIMTSAQIELAGVTAQRDRITTMLKANQRIEERRLHKLQQQKRQTQTIIGILEKAQSSSPAQPFETESPITIWHVSPPEPVAGLPPAPPPPGVEGRPRPPVPPPGVDGEPRRGPPPGADDRRDGRSDRPGRPGQMQPPPVGGPHNPPPPGTERGPRNPPPPGADSGHRPPPPPAGPKGQQPPPPPGNEHPDQPPPSQPEGEPGR